MWKMGAVQISPIISTIITIIISIIICYFPASLVFFSAFHRRVMLDISPKLGEILNINFPLERGFLSIERT